MVIITSHCKYPDELLILAIFLQFLWSEHSTTNNKHFSSTQLHLRGWMSYGCILKGTMPMSCSTPSQSMCSISFVSFNVLSIHAPWGVSTPQDVRDRAITTVWASMSTWLAMLGLWTWLFLIGTLCQYTHHTTPSVKMTALTSKCPAASSHRRISHSGCSWIEKPFWIFTSWVEAFSLALALARNVVSNIKE